MSQAAEKKSNNNNNNRNYYKKERHDHGDGNDNKSGNDVRAGKPNPKNFKGGKKNLLDDSKEQAELKALYDKIAAEKKKINEVSDQIQGFKDSRKGGQGGNRGPGGKRKGELLQKKKDLFNTINHLKAQREALGDQLSALKLPIANKKKDQTLEEYIELNVAEFNKQISNIEKDIQFGNLNLSEEKRKISELEKVKKTRGGVEEYRRKAEEFEHVKSAMKEKTEEVKAVKTELDEIFNSEKALNEEFDKKKKSDEEKQQYYQSLLDQKTLHQNNIKTIREQATAKKEEIDAKWAAWKVEQGKLKEKRHEEYLQRKADKEQQQKEYLENKAKRLQEEEEERKREEELKLPFSDDIAKAEFLLTYLSGLRYPKNKPNLQIKHNIDTYVHFEEFSISPPCVAKDIEGVKGKIQQKKDDLLEKQKAEIVKREELKQQQAQNPPAQDNQPKENEAEVKNENAAEVPVEANN